VKGSEFLNRAKKLADRKGLHYEFLASKGKGSHGKLYLGSASTTVKDRRKELGPGLLRAMCKQLGIDPDEL
jgi:mRNA interferase HicA